MGRRGRREQSITVFVTKKPKTLFELAVVGWRTVTATGKEGMAALEAFIPQFHSHFCKKVATPCCLRGDHVAKSSLHWGEGDK